MIGAMRVVHLESGRQMNGGAEQVRCLVSGLSALGVDNVLVCQRHSALGAAATGGEVIELELGGDADLAQLGRLKRLFGALAPDLIHVHSRRGADLYGGWAARLAGRPAVLTRRIEDREPRWWSRLKLEPYAAVIAISRVIERRLTEWVGLEAERVHLVPSGVDPDRYRPARRRERAKWLEPFGLPADAVLIGVVAQLIARKGHAVLLDALPAILDACPQARLVCFGRGPLEGALRARARARGVARRVHWVGFRSDLDRLLPGLDVVVHPALREGLGVALLEALAAGVPVVASAAGGIVDLIRDGVEGRLVPPGDAGALAVAVTELLADPAARRRLGAAGRARVTREFTAARMAQAHLPIYEAVLDASRAGHSRAEHLRAGH